MNYLSLCVIVYYFALMHKLLVVMNDLCVHISSDPPLFSLRRPLSTTHQFSTDKKVLILLRLAVIKVQFMEAELKLSSNIENNV